MSHINQRAIEYSIDELGCHICTSHGTNGKGYPKIKRNGRTFLISRFVFEQVNGKIPEGLVVRHKCDKPLCINPDHLELGTQADNNNDKMQRGRHATGKLPGESNPMAELKEEDVVIIRNDKTSTNVELGRKYGVHHSTISAIRLRKIWKHIS